MPSEAKRSELFFKHLQGYGSERSERGKRAKRATRASEASEASERSERSEQILSSLLLDIYSYIFQFFIILLYSILLIIIILLLFFKKKLPPGEPTHTRYISIYKKKTSKV